MTAAKSIGARSIIVGSMWIVSGPAFAYHDSTSHMGAPIGAILPIVIAVAVGVIVLSMWKPQSRRGKARKRGRAPGHRASHKRSQGGRG